MSLRADRQAASSPAHEEPRRYIRSDLGGWAEGRRPVMKEVRKGAYELKSHCGASAVLACESTLVTANLSLSIQ